MPLRPAAVRSSQGWNTGFERCRHDGREPVGPEVVDCAQSADGFGADPARSLLLQTAELGAYALVERGVWSAQGVATLAVLVDGDPKLAEPVHVMRSFRASHPAGKMFVDWIAGRRGHSVVAKQRGYRPPPA